MKVWRFTERAFGTEHLKIVELPDPAAGPGEDRCAGTRLFAQLSRSGGDAGGIRGQCKAAFDPVVGWAREKFWRWGRG